MAFTVTERDRGYSPTRTLSDGILHITFRGKNLNPANKRLILGI